MEREHPGCSCDAISDFDTASDSKSDYFTRRKAAGSISMRFSSITVITIGKAFLVELS